MKKSKIILVPVLILVYAILFSIGFECMISFTGLIGAVTLDTHLSAVQQYPRFTVFCVVVGLVALVSTICLLIFNYNISEKFNYTKAVWRVQFILAFIISIPMIPLWEMLFEFLRITY